MIGSGTVSDPYIIQDVDDLQAMADDLTAYYKLFSNINASVTSGWNSGAGFIPIGTSGDKFTGELDGDGYTISSLFINRASTDGVGLFGYTSGATLKNINMTSVNITGQTLTGALVGSSIGSSGTIDISNCSTAGSITGTDGVGGLVGSHQNSTIDDCSSSCAVTGASSVGGLVGAVSGGFDYEVISDSYATGNVTGTTTQIGGLVGFSIGGAKIVRCSATGNVTGGATGDRVGGFVGSNSQCDMDDCYGRGSATGDDCVGGFCGRTAGTYAVIDNCYSTGVPTGNTNVGGFLGLNYSDQSTITNCFWDTETSGESTSDGGTGRTTAVMKTESNFTDAGWDFTDIWNIDGATNNGYPFLRALVSHIVYPADATTRVTGLVHRYMPGNYTLELMLGDIRTEWGTSMPQSTMPDEVAARLQKALEDRPAKLERFRDLVARREEFPTIREYLLQHPELAAQFPEYMARTQPVPKPEVTPPVLPKRMLPAVEEAREILRGGFGAAIRWITERVWRR